VFVIFTQMLYSSWFRF